MSNSEQPSFGIVHRYEVDPQNDNRATLWDEFVPRLKAIPGFVAVYTFDAPMNKEGVSLTFWETQEAAETYLNSTDRQQLDNSAAAFRPKTDRRLMTILAQEDNRITVTDEG